METIDNLFNHCSQISDNYESVEYSDDILLVKNIFKFPEKMLQFEKLLTKWESRGNAKPGMMTLKLPYWTGNEIATRVLNLDNYVETINEVEFIYFYYNNICLDSNIYDLRSNNCFLPHTDPGPTRNVTNIIGLINLNQRPVKTGFWKFKGNLTDNDESLSDEYTEYTDTINYDNYHEKVNNGILDNVFNIEYNFNDAIFYNSLCYHQPIIDKFYTRENPRIMMRLCFVLDESQN